MDGVVGSERDDFAEEPMDCREEPGHRGEPVVPGDGVMQLLPEPLDRIQLGAVGGKCMNLDAAAVPGRGAGGLPTEVVM
jgi:hypothetical protein